MMILLILSLLPFLFSESCSGDVMMVMMMILKMTSFPSLSPSELE